MIPSENAKKILTDLRQVMLDETIERHLQLEQVLALERIADRLAALANSVEIIANWCEHNWETGR